MAQRTRSVRPDTVFIREPNVLLTTLEDENLLLNLETGDYFALNASALAIWNFLDGRRSVDQVITLVAKEFELPLEMAAGHASAFVGELKRSKLVRPAS